MSPEALDAVRRAHELADDRHDAVVAPAHLMLGVLAAAKSTAMAILFRYEIGPARLGAHLYKLLPSVPTARRNRSSELSHAAAKSLATATAEAATMHRPVGAGHILLGLLADRRSVVGMILRDHGLTEEGVRAAIRRQFE